MSGDSRGPNPDRTLEVCREFTRQRCQRSENECRFAHPPPHCEVVNGRVTCCVDSIKGRCQRDKCRYFHPPPHLGEKLLRGGGPVGGGRDSFGGQRGGPRGGGGPGSGRGDFGGDVGINPYLANALQGYKSALDAAALAATWLTGGPQGAGGPSGAGRGPSSDRGPSGSRSDSIEVCREFLRGRCNRQENECRYAHPPDNITVGFDNTVIACIDFIKGRCQRNPCRYFHPPEHLQSRIRFGTGPPTTQGSRKRPYSSTSGALQNEDNYRDNGDIDYKRQAYDGIQGLGAAGGAGLM